MRRTTASSPSPVTGPGAAGCLPDATQRAPTNRSLALRTLSASVCGTVWAPHGREGFGSFSVTTLGADD